MISPRVNGPQDEAQTQVMLDFGLFITAKSKDLQHTIYLFPHSLPVTPFPLPLTSSTSSPE